MNNIKGAKDITDKWTKVSKQGFIKEMKYYKHNGVKYPVDGHHVVIKPSIEEREVANVLARKYGKNIYLVPRINIPTGIQTPDYIINGSKFDLKSPTGNGKETLFNLIKKKNRQSNKFIFNLNYSSLNDVEICKQVCKIFTSEETKFINTIVLIKNETIMSVFIRKTGQP